MLAARRPEGYVPDVSSDATTTAAHPLCQAHRDDRDDVRDAVAGAERGELLSPEASEAFLQWLEGNADDSWRNELA